MAKLYFYSNANPAHVDDCADQSWAFDTKPDGCIRRDDYKGFCARVNPTTFGKKLHPDVPAGKVGVFEFVGLINEAGDEPHGGDIWITCDTDGHIRVQKNKPSTRLDTAADWATGALLCAGEEARDLAHVAGGTPRGTATRFRLVPVETLKLGYDNPAPTIEALSAEVEALKARIAELED